MSHTNETANLQLPQFIDTDQPTWLGDINVAFAKIDTKAGAQDGLIDGAVQNSSSALNIANQASATANSASASAISAHEEAVLAESIANNALTVANNTASLAQKFVKTRLWHNDTPNVAFDGQDVTLSDTIANFLELEILFEYQATGESALVVSYAKVTDTYANNTAIRTSITSSDRVQSLQRPFTINGTTGRFNSCTLREFLISSSGPTFANSVHNEFLIPIAIYGYSTLNL